jgi:hypothetical protein
MRESDDARCPVCDEYRADCDCEDMERRWWRQFTWRQRIRMKLHVRLERICSRYVGRCFVARRWPERSPLWFRAASKLEWWLRPGPIRVPKRRTDAR